MFLIPDFFLIVIPLGRFLFRILTELNFDWEWTCYTSFSKKVNFFSCNFSTFFIFIGVKEKFVKIKKALDRPGKIS